MPRLTLLLAAAVLALPLAGPIQSEAMAGTPVAGSARVALEWNAPWRNLAASAQRNRVVVLHAWEADRMRALKRENPSLKVLVYKALTASIDSSKAGHISTGVSYGFADARHPEWFLLNTDGQRFTSRGWPFLWMMDIGNREYQKKWAEDSAAAAKADGWDGVFIDDLTPTIKYHYTPSRVARYPTDSAYAAAANDAISYIAPRIQSEGLLAVANMATWAEHPDICSRWLGLLDGAMDEMWLKWSNSPGEGYRGEQQWTRQLGALKEAQRQRKIFIGITHSARDDAQAARYGWATTLLGAEGKASFALAPDWAYENWFPEYDYDIGVPRGPEYPTAQGVHARRFERGLVLVNPTEATQRVGLGGTYSGSGYTRTRDFLMPPHTGLVLKRDAGVARIVSRPRVVRRRRIIVKVACPRSGTACKAHVKLVAMRGGKGAHRSRARVVARRFVNIRSGTVKKLTVKMHKRDYRLATGRKLRLRALIIR